MSLAAGGLNPRYLTPAAALPCDASQSSLSCGAWEAVSSAGASSFGVSSISAFWL